MKTPKTVKGYLKMLILIAGEQSIDLKNVTNDEMHFIGEMRGAIQNCLGEDQYGVLKKHKLKWEG